MSKDLHKNEHYLKELADKHNPPPPPLVWDEIEQVLDKGKRKRRSFPFIWLFGILLIGTIMFFYIDGKKDKAISMVEPKTTINDHNKQAVVNSTDISKGDSEELSKSKPPSSVSDLETQSSFARNQEERNADSKMQNSDVTRYSLSKSFSTSTSTTSTTNRSSKTNSNITQSTIPATIIEEDIVAQRTIRQPPRIVQGDSQCNQVSDFPRLKWIGRPFPTTILLPDPSKNLIALPSDDSDRNEIQLNPWFVELGGGIGRDLSTSVLTDHNQGNYRLNTESKWYSWSSSLQVGYQLKNQWYTNIGFDLNQTKTKFDFWRRDLSSLIVGDNQNLQVRKLDFFSVGEIRYTFADIGLSIGKRVNINKWHISLEGGPVFNVLFNANGKVQVGALEFSRLEKQDGYFNTHIGFGARLSAMLDYPITDRIWISCGPSYHQYFDSLSSELNPLEERNAILQVKTKLRYHF